MTEKVARISIVTPTFNQATYIGELLLSVKEQNYPNVEHIVVDDGSTDNSLEILKRWASTPGWEHLRWTPEPHCGQSAASNKGFKLATGDVIGWISSDDRYRPGCFGAVLEAFGTFPEVDLIYGDFTLIDEVGRVWQIRREIEFSHFVLRYHRVLYIPHNATFFRRRVIDEGNLVDDRFDYAPDYEFFLRLAEKGYRFKHIPQLLADYRVHPRSRSSSQPSKQLQEHDQIAQMYSPILRRLPIGLCRRLGLYTLRPLAATLRYSEKLLRGYYFSQFRPSTLLKRQHPLR
jgi:glycosyltransferase involved in cell wall biosynthesis